MNDEDYTFRAVIGLLVVDGHKPRTIMKAFQILDLDSDSESFTPDEMSSLYKECDRLT